MNGLLVFVGGMLGTMLRYSLSISWTNRGISSFPFPILLVNLLGSLLFGTIMGVSTHFNESSLLLLTTGGLGGFTTFSTFSVEALELWHKGHRKNCIWYVGLSIIGSCLSCYGGNLLITVFS